MKYLILFLFSTTLFAQTAKVIPNRALNQDFKICVNTAGGKKCPIDIDGVTGKFKGTAGLADDGNIGLLTTLGITTNASDITTLEGTKLEQQIFIFDLASQASFTSGKIICFVEGNKVTIVQENRAFHPSASAPITSTNFLSAACAPSIATGDDASVVYGYSTTNANIMIVRTDRRIQFRYISESANIAQTSTGTATASVTFYKP